VSKLTDLFGRAKQVIQNEGLIAFVRQGFVAGNLFQYETYYLTDDAVENVAKLNEADFMPKIDNFTFKIIISNRDLDELTAQGFDFRPRYHIYRKRLDRGAIAFCVFVGRELANMSWVAMTEQAKDSLNHPPYKVDFSKGEACAGAVWTNPRYRRMGLTEYTRLKRYQFQLEKGVVTNRGLYGKGNIPVRKVSERVSSTYAEARYMKILWWKSWKEKPLT